MKPILAGLVAIASIAGAATGAQAQSFNCRKAYFADEKLICTSPELSRLDERLDRIFGQNRRLLSQAGRDALDREEERWVVARRRCGPDHRCVEDFYRRPHRRADRELGEARGDDRGRRPRRCASQARDGPPPERFARAASDRAATGRSAISPTAASRASGGADCQHGNRAEAEAQ